MAAMSAATLREKVDAVVRPQIQADAPHLVETIKRQFSDPDEYARELVANGADAGASRIVIDGGVEVKQGREYAWIRYDDDGHGMGFSEVESYLSLFESIKDSGRDCVGRHGVGKLSPWAKPGLCRYVVDTRHRGEQTILDMSSPDTGEISRYRRDSADGTRITLYFEADNGRTKLRSLLNRAEKTLTCFCCYLTCTVIVRRCDGGHRQDERELTSTPEDDGWVRMENSVCDDDGITFYARFGRGSGLYLYQSRIFLKHYRMIECTPSHGGVAIPANVEVMADSQAFEIPISRNDVSRNEAFGVMVDAVNERILPAFMERLCDRLRGGVRTEALEEYDRIVDTVLDYLTVDPTFGPAQSLPLIPALPFRLLSVEMLRRAYRRTKRTYLCTYSTTDPERITGGDMLIDAERLSSRGRTLLEACFAPLILLDYEKDVVEMKPGAPRYKPLTDTEKRLEQSLALLSDPDIAVGGDAEERSVARGLASAGMGGGTTNGPRSEYRGRDDPEIPELSFRLTYLVRMDGVTPATETKSIVRDNAVLLNLYHPEVHTIVRIAEKNADLAAHLCLRELLIRDSIEPVRHLDMAARDAMLYADAYCRCLGRDGGRKKRQRTRPPDDDPDWLEWRRFLGI